MHSTSGRPSLGERRSELPRMPWPLGEPLRRLQLPIVLAPFLLTALPVVGEQRGRRGRQKQRRRLRQKRKATLVASRFVRVVYTRRSAGAHAGPRKRREATVPA